MVPQSAIELAKRFEGFEKRVKRGTEIAAVPYVCPAGFWTIGYGHLCAQDHPPITQDEAEAYLAQDLVKALSATLRYCPVLATAPEQRLAAIVDSYSRIARQFGISPSAVGLIKRRERWAHL